MLLLYEMFRIYNKLPTFVKKKIAKKILQKPEADLIEKISIHQNPRQPFCYPIATFMTRMFICSVLLFG